MKKIVTLWVVVWSLTLWGCSNIETQVSKIEPIIKEQVETQTNSWVIQTWWLKTDNSVKKESLNTEENILNKTKINSLDDNEDMDVINNQNITDEILSLWWLYTKDKNNIYFNNIIVEWSDLNSFTNIWEDEHFGCWIECYWKDKNNIYYKSSVIEWADLKTFEIVKWPFSKDRDNCYFKTKKISWIYPSSFFSFSWFSSFANRDTFVQDNNNLYDVDYNNPDNFIKYPDIDIKTFKNLSENYSKDNNRTYYHTKECWDWCSVTYFTGIQLANPKYFSILDENYATDNKNVFYNNCWWSNYEKREWWCVHSILKQADLNTFKVTWRWKAEDKNNHYLNWKITE